MKSRSQRGSILVEFAVALPVMLLLILGGIDLSIASGAKNGLNYIATETATCVARTPGCGAQPYAQSLATGVGMSPSKVTVTAIGACGPTCTTVTVQYVTTPISPFMKRLTMTSTGNATK